MRYALCALFVFALAIAARAETPQQMLRADQSLLQPPKYEDAEKVVSKEPNVRGVFYDTKTWQGKPTKSFAWIGIPKHQPGEKLPAMVLVHGGGGTAFDNWVKLWNDRGYAAIAMDVCGCVPVKVPGTKTWQRGEEGGPGGWDPFPQIEQPVTDQWPYQAMCDVILANSLIRSLPDVDADRVGLTGISWGGYLTCMVPAVDARFKFAVPVYGCGFIDECVWKPNLAKLPKEQAERWLQLWDPRYWLPNVTMPTLWVDGTNDKNYLLGPLQKSYELVKGPRTLCVTLRMRHAHGPGETPEVIHVFADSFLKSGAPLAEVTGQGNDQEHAWASFKGQAKIEKAELLYTTDVGPWPARKWDVAPAEVASDHRVTASLPSGTHAWFFNLTDDRGVWVSSEHVELP